MSKIVYAELMSMVCTPVVPTGCLVVAVDPDMFGVLPEGHRCQGVLERKNKRDRLLRRGDSLTVYVIKSPSRLYRYKITNDDGKAKVVREYPLPERTPDRNGDGLP